MRKVVTEPKSMSAVAAGDGNSHSVSDEKTRQKRGQEQRAGEGRESWERKNKALMGPVGWTPDWCDLHFLFFPGASTEFLPW